MVFIRRCFGWQEILGAAQFSLISHKPFIGTVGKALIDALLPQQCALCAAGTGSDAPVCPACVAKLPTLPEPSCPQCADFSAAAILCGQCISTPPAFDAVISPYLYAEPMDQLIHQFKYQHQLRLASWFGQELYRAIEKRAQAMTEFDCIVPLALHPARMKTRGFNQAHEIARAVARQSALPLRPHALLRTRDTAQQASLSREDRRRNMSGAFECREDFAGKTVLLLDDVLTTGSSAGEVARVLKLHGATRVVVAVVARTQHR